MGVATAVQLTHKLNSSQERSQSDQSVTSTYLEDLRYSVAPSLTSNYATLDWLGLNHRHHLPQVT